jgi:diguanylate cyclase (GGDEF)-like protein
LIPELPLAMLAASAAHTLGAAVVAVLLFGFSRQYEKDYVAHWTWSWVALAVYRLADAAGIPLIADPARYLHVAWLLFGVYELARRRPVRIRLARQILAGVVVAGAAGALLLAQPVRARVSVVVIAAAYVVAGAGFIAARTRRAAIGFTVTAMAFVAYAVASLLAIGSLDLLFQSLIGIGMIASLLEDEREASELAADEIAHVAYHDALTGMPNRPLFIDRLIVALAQARRANQRLAVFFLDLDRFKDINDSLGHYAGDTLLKSVAERIRRCVREGDTVARFGGDEFTILIPRIATIEDAAKIAQKILDTLKLPVAIGNRELFVTASVGIGIFPEDGADPETLVRNADTAMYRAKEQGRDGYQLYAPAMNACALERLALENTMRKALIQHELTLFYQPVVELSTNRIVGLEALIRWQHPELGLLLPAQFISTAEVSGLIVPIGKWVLQTACRQIRQWQKRVDDPDFTVSVNLSARQFQQLDLVSSVAEALEETGIDPRTLELEITESNAMHNTALTMQTLRDLKGLGVRISLDDFGTGYSSLNYLKNFPIDTLKLDQSFVREVPHDRNDTAIVSAVIALAHSLDLNVVAEGVETEEQLAFLHAQRCDRIQGFLFSAPMSAEQLEPYLVERRAVNAG